MLAFTSIIQPQTVAILDRSDVRGRELRRWSPSARAAVMDELRQRGGTTAQAMERVRASVR